jgi:putative redox protein
MIETLVTDWAGNLAFESSIDGFSVKMDTDPLFGGTGYGVRPKPMLLSALAGCTGMDVVSILKKKKVPLTSFRILITGETSETHPKSYIRIHLVFEVTGPAFESDQSVIEKVERAVQLSRDNYCAVHAMLKHAAEITHEIRVFNS